MKEEIKALLCDDRIYGLMETPEFHAARFKLENIMKRIEAGGNPTKQEVKYIERCEHFIKDIYPHVKENYCVNGEWGQQVRFITRC